MRIFVHKGQNEEDKPIDKAAEIHKLKAAMIINMYNLYTNKNILYHTEYFS